MKIALTGFYGHGNAGDEAMGLALSGRLIAAGHEVYVMSDVPVCYPGAHYRDSRARATVEHCDRLVIGGGDLGIGFGWQLIPAAMAAGRSVVLAGMDFPHQWTGNGHDRAARVIRAVLESCERIWPRNQVSYDRLVGMGLTNIHLGADPAFLLQVPEVERRDVALIYLRGPRWSVALERCRAAAVDSLPAGTIVQYVACARDDELLIESLGLDPVRPRTPLDSLTLAASARIVVSLRRLHPLIFAHHVGTPAAAVCDDCHHPPEKIAAFCADAGTACVTANHADRLAGAVQAEWDGQAVDASDQQARARAMLAAITGEVADART
jgi:polysaccharide pyruvyl transferase WcaK-like protein